MKERKKLVHIHSNVLDKQPTPQALELGELAVNYAAYNSDASGSSGSFIATKNSSGDVVRFSEDGLLVDWMEYKEVLPYSASVVSPTTQDLENNRSQLVVKLNQEVASKTPGSAEVSGKTDIHGQQIGSGFGIDMSLYAMNGANPSFSSVTITKGMSISGSSLSADTNTIDLNATQTRVKGETMVVAATENNLGLSAKSDILESAEGDIIISANNDICETCGNDATFCGVENTNIGIDCSGATVSLSTAIHGKDVSIEGESLSLLCDGELTIDTNVLGANASTVDVHSKNSSIFARNDAVMYGNDNTFIGEDNNDNVSNNVSVSARRSINISTYNENQEGDILVAGDGISILAYSALTLEGPYETNITSNNGAATISAKTNSLLYGKDATIIGANNDNVKSNMTFIQGNDVTIESASNGRVIMQGGNDGRVVLNADDSIEIVGESVDVVGGGSTTIGLVNSTQSGLTTTVQGNEVIINSGNKLGLTANTNSLLYGKDTTVVGANDNNVKSNMTFIEGNDVTIESADNGRVLMQGGNDGRVVLNADGSVEFIGESVDIFGGDSTTIGAIESAQSGLTTTVQGNKVVINSDDKLGLTAKDDIDTSSESNITLTADGNLTSTCGNEAMVYGANSTNIGVGLDSNVSSLSTSINGQLITINGSLIDCATSLFDLSGNEHISGDLTVDGNIYGTVVSPSDERLKNSIEAIDEEKLENAHNVEFKQFVFNDNDGKVNYGAIAQDVQNNNLNELVSEDSKGFLGINYTSLLVMKVAYLEKEVDRLNKKLSQLPSTMIL